MFLQSIAIFFLAIVQHSYCYHTMNESNDPLRQFLQLDPDSQLDLVKIEFPDRLHKRSFTGETMPNGFRMRIRPFGNDVDLWLHPRDSHLITEATPVYFSRYSPDKPENVSIEQKYGLMKELGQIFEDPRNLASLIIGKDDYGRTTVDGRIESKNLVIRSLPESVVNEYARKRRSFDDLEDNLSDSPYHVVYTTIDDFKTNYSLGVFNETRQTEKVAPSTSGIPYVIYPKILLVVDFSVYRKQGKYINRFLEYLVAFANGIDLKYRSLEYPSVRLHISGILIGADPEAIPYISNVMLNDYTFNSEIAMIDARPFFYKINDSIPIKSYNIALSITRLTFGLKDAAGVLGKGWTGVACSNSSVVKRLDAVAMARDNGEFSGVHIAAHELGHVLGLNHDAKQNDYCHVKNGFIMAFIPVFTSNSSSFSPCSVRDFQSQLDNKRLECMYEKPLMYYQNLPRLMPGRVKSLDEQCRALYRQRSCNVSNPDTCMGIYCLDNQGKCEKTYAPALEGTRCSDENASIDRYCVFNRCVHV